jgi:hypothetical protein
MISIAKRYPKAFHMGYFFSYDQNMIIRSLSAKTKIRLYDKGLAKVKYGTDLYWIKYIPRKSIQITHSDWRGKTNIRIEDFAHFYGTSFVKAYRSTFPDCENDPSFKIIMEGKAMRSDTTWQDFPTIRRYWSQEIKAMQRLAESLRTVLYAAGFIIKEWHGPGALASYVRKREGLIPHEWGCKALNMPDDVHQASKYGMFGGRFEPFKLGRIAGPIYVYDRNSAYPYAFTTLPSFREGGQWEHFTGDSDYMKEVVLENHFAIYHVEWHRPHGFPPMDGKPWPDDMKLFLNGWDIPPEPLPYRDHKSRICYPDFVEGWYWSPEIRSILAVPNRAKNLTIYEGWAWIPADNSERPWSEVINPMFNERLKRKAAGDPTQMAYKLAMNSLYGKSAQRKGWNKIKNTAPGSHALPIAGYITSHCRAAVWNVIQWAYEHDGLVAVETDGVITTVPPDTFGYPIGKDLGEWSVTEYDEILFLQSGFYAARKGDDWTLKTRGIPATAFEDEYGRFDSTIYSDFLSSCGTDSRWPDMPMPSSKRFCGIGAALARSKREDGNGINLAKLIQIHCRWESDTPVLHIGTAGKRRHSHRICRPCKSGLNANDAAHDTVVVGAIPPWRDMRDPVVSFQYRIPWDKAAAMEADDDLIREMEDFTDEWVREENRNGE